MEVGYVSIKVLFEILSSGRFFFVHPQINTFIYFIVRKKRVINDYTAQQNGEKLVRNFFTISRCFEELTFKIERFPNMNLVTLFSKRTPSPKV
jgi:hypothetical protein